MDYQAIIDFWFHEIDHKLWWKKDVGFDRLISERFLSTHQAAMRCELFEWRVSALGRLAEIIVLDQFSRNMYRDQPGAFAYDALTLCLAQEAAQLPESQALSAVQRAFLYMPFMHSESPRMHEIAVELYSAAGLEQNLKFELKHKAIIDRFGRYPHRNRILGRESTQEELAFLQQPGSSF